MTSGPNIPRSQRKRPEITLTLAAEAHEALEHIPRGKRSEYVSELILDDAHSRRQLGEARALLLQYAAEYGPVRAFLGIG